MPILMMKKTLSLVTLALGFVTSAHAEMVRESCYSASNGDELVLTLAGDKLFSINLIGDGAQYGRELLVTKLSNASTATVSRYLVNGQAGLLEVDNSILEQKDGNVLYGMRTYSCRF